MTLTAMNGSDHLPTFPPCLPHMIKIRQIDLIGGLSIFPTLQAREEEN